MSNFFVESKDELVKSIVDYIKNPEAMERTAVKADPYTGPLLFRHHRGALEDSMKTVVEVKSLDELTKLVAEAYELFDKSKDTINVEFYGYDDRIGWNTHMVSIIDRNGKVHPIGWTSGELK